MSRKTLMLVLGGMVTVGLVAFQAGRTTAEEKAKQRLYELRIYTALPGRLDALNARFKNHTMKLFEKHGMKNGLYWIPTEPAPAPKEGTAAGPAYGKDNTLIYFVSHDSREAADKSWKDFIADPAWKAVAAESEKDGKIVAKVDKWYMTLTDYSPADTAGAAK